MELDVLSEKILGKGKPTERQAPCGFREVFKPQINTLSYRLVASGF